MEVESRAHIDLLGVKSKLSIAFHLKIDGQTESINQMIEQYLRHYCLWNQDDCDELLPMAEYAYNSTMFESHHSNPIMEY